MDPLTVAPHLALDRRRWIPWIPAQPVSDHIVIELLRPQHSREALPHDVLGVGREFLRNDRAIKFAGFVLAQCKSILEFGEAILALEVAVR